ncbi:MAG: HAMP domain-containing protein [Spirochaetales bacterium]|nr:HAMP domain-containing protein [Spirochaetales bacterium]
MRRNKTPGREKRKGLLLEISASFFVLALLITVVMAVAIGITIKTAYGRFVRQNDRQTARQLADLFNKSDNGFSDFFENLQNGSLFLHQSPVQRFRDRRMMDQRRRPPEKRIIVLGDDREAIFDSHPEFPVPRLNPNDGFLVKDRNGNTGLLFTGTMIDPRLGENDRRLIFRINMAILFSLAAGLVFAAIMAWLLAARITKPITVVSAAAGSLAGGKLDTRVHISRKNETGDLAAAFNSMADSLQHNIQVQKDLIADTAHELRTPVSLIQNRLELMLDGVYPLDRKEIEHVYRDSIQLGKLIEDLQQLFSAEAEETFYSFQTADLEDLLERSVKSFEVKAREKNVSIQFRSEAHIPKLYIDPARMVQVFHNIMINALEWTPKDSSVTVACSKANDKIAIEIEDDGPGIAAEYRQRIFDRLYRIDSSRNRARGGSGIGLAICKQIITRHQGSIEALQDKRGALFRILLPVAPVAG